MESNDRDALMASLVELDSRYVMQTYRRLPVAFVRGSGARLWDSAGREYLDLVGGLGVVVLGHCHPAVTAAICEQVRMLIHTTNLYYVEPQPSLAQLLVRHSLAGRCFFANSGAEANECALKIARKHHFLKGESRGKVVCALDAFHGRTLATLSATGQPPKWKPFQPVMPGFEHVRLNDVEGLESAVDEDTVAVMLEPVQGESGIWPASAEFLAAAREACDRTGAVLIFDEVQCGMGRTGTFLACHASGVEPDIVTLAKGLANGVPAAAVIAAGEYGEVLSSGDHGTTFGGGFLACSAALATLGVLFDEDLPANADRVGRFLLKGLKDIVTEVPLAQGVRGRGLMIALELSDERSREVVDACLDRGLLVNGVTKSAVRLLPPLNLTEEEASEGLRILRGVLSDMN